MATQYANGKIVTDGLVLNLDGGDQNSLTSGSIGWNDLAGSYVAGTPFTTPGTASVQSISYLNLGTGSLGLQYTGSVDDTFFNVPLPFSMSFLGTNYNNVFMSSNSFITFGVGSSAFAFIEPNNPPYPGVHIAATDVSIQRLYTGSEDGNQTYRVRYEGYKYPSFNAASGSNMIYSLIFYSSSNQIDLHVDSMNPQEYTYRYYGYGGKGITNGTSSFYLADLNIYSGSQYAYRITTNTGSCNFVEPTSRLYYGAAYTGSGKGAVYFDGRSDYTVVPNKVGVVDFTTESNYTINFWVNPDAVQNFRVNGDNDIIEKWSDGGANVPYPFVIRHMWSDRSMNAAIYDGTSSFGIFTGAEFFKTSSWQYISTVFNWSSSYLEVYYNGVLTSSSLCLTTSQSISNTSSLYIAKRGPNPVNGVSRNFFAGSLANITIYNKALSANEVLQNYNLYKVRFGLK